MYEIEEEKLSKPPKRINLSLSLIRNTTNESKQEASTTHRVEVNEISSRVEPSNQTEAAFGTNSVLRENYNNGKARISQLHMTRVAKKVAAARVSYSTIWLHANLVHTEKNPYKSLVETASYLTFYDFHKIIILWR